MARINWKSLMSHEGDTLLKFLHDSEKEVARAIRGIGDFLLKKVPELFREMVIWLQDRCIYACCVAIRLSRLLALFSAWIAIVFGPIALYPGITTCFWVATAIIGSVWGIRRTIKKQPFGWQFNKGNHHA